MVPPMTHRRVVSGRSSPWLAHRYFEMGDRPGTRKRWRTRPAHNITRSGGAQTSSGSQIGRRKHCLVQMHPDNALPGSGEKQEIHDV
ncbi:hypothetical protein DRB87_10430 [Pandoraea sp. XY-2]|nr:hypothetical protein DRB87_10430 [Pandoraea sp. XY-2]